MSSSSRSAGHDSPDGSSDFVALLREFLTAYEALSRLLDRTDGEDVPFDDLRALVRDDERAVLYRLKEKSHALFRHRAAESETVRREALFDLAVGSLFHEAMNLREGLYQRQVYAPRIEALRVSSADESDALFDEFARILDKNRGRLRELVAEVKILLAQTREQFRKLVVERAGDPTVTRCLLARRAEVDGVFPEGFAGLLESMHGDFATGLVVAARALVESAWFVEASQTLREAVRESGAPDAEIERLSGYAAGMQSFLDGDYVAALRLLEDWVDLSGAASAPELARRAAAALGRIGRLVESDALANELDDRAKQLQLRLETALS